MFKIIVALMVAGSMLIAVGTIWLVVLNWSQKLYGPLVSIALGGLVTVLITVVALLREERIQDTFATALAFDASTNSLPLVTPDLGSPSVAFRLSEMSMLAAKVPVREPQSSVQTLRDDDLFRYCGELLQYQIVRSLQRFQAGGWVSTQLGAEASAEIRHPARISRTSEYQGEEILRILGGNRFAQSGSERFLWQHSRLRLPQATRLTLEYVPSSPETGPERHTVRLVKSGFFEVTFEVTPIIATGTGVLPAGLVLPADQRSHIRTFQYEVRMSADFYRLTAGNWQTEELKNWARWLFSEVKKSLGDG